MRKFLRYFELRANARWLAALVLGLAVGSAVAAVEFPAAGNDDSHITFWAAHALATHGSILNYNGAHVEQSSSFTLVWLLAAAHRLGLPIPATAWGLGIAFAVAAVVVASSLGRRLHERAGAITALLLATSLPFAYWATSGMEASLTALLGTLLIVVSGKAIEERWPLRDGRRLGTIVLMLAFALVRPETPLVLGCTLAGTTLFYLLRSRRARGPEERERVRSCALELALAALVVGVVFGGRYLAFHAFVPNSALAKVGGFRLSAGGDYLWKGLLATNPLLAAVAVVGGVLAVRDARDGRAGPQNLLLVSF
ncbi:MAG TPA: hypothetical protein VGQ57_10270, partial [Polyangiaceae bacterium]|nr:hypothetical protein [Polyangiaceae bacterium]